MSFDDRKGFTIIELIMVVVIIALLVTIAIPQFAAYRMRGYNAAVVSDLRNGSSAEEALSNVSGGYGITDQSMLPGAGGTGTGKTISGPLSAATAITAGGIITAGPTASGGAITGFGISVSNNVFVRADTVDFNGSLAGYGSAYVITAKHLAGDSAYARESESTALFMCRSSQVTWVNTAGLGMVAIPDVTTATDLITTAGGAVACGGSEISSWTAI